MTVPLYGFLEGDTIGLLVLAQENDTVATLAERLQKAAGVRVAPMTQATVVHDGRSLDGTLTLKAAGIQPLDRIDVRRSGGGA
jgi:hypothetical protein